MRRQRPAMKLNDVAVLYRTHNNREEMFAELRRRDIPVHVEGVDLFETPGGPRRDGGVCRSWSRPIPLHWFG